ncbi:hypothetical protein [Rhizobium mesoamericanum]|uniref:hypothetical protein n=1 Tax=Rhizobium mesoamericanum TaxID=1079800 RepID=UPI0005932CFD|nr:hypothetical protein [Rhizobium mesoamericanum]
MCAIKMELPIRLIVVSDDQMREAKGLWVSSFVRDNDSFQSAKLKMKSDDGTGGPRGLLPFFVEHPPAFRRVTVSY